MGITARKQVINRKEIKIKSYLGIALKVVIITVMIDGT